MVKYTKNYPDGLIVFVFEVKPMAPNFGCYKIVLKRPKKDYKVEISSKKPAKSRLNLSPLLQKYGKKG